MKNTLYKISMVMAVVVSSVSCSKYLDINDSPNAAVEVDPKLLFSNASTALFNNRSGGDLYLPMALAGQSQAGGGSSSEGWSWGAGGEDQYVFSPFFFGNIWTQYYTTVAFNLKNAIDLCENPPGDLAPNLNAAAQSKVILAETFYELATIYGDVPFSEALNEEVLYPKFDTQEEVINGAIALLDEALDQFDEASPFKFTAEYDQLYGGNIARWKKAARSLKLRMLMTIVDRDNTKAAAIGQLVTEGGMISSAADNMFVAFEDVAGKKNPKFMIIEQYAALDDENDPINFFYASSYVLDYMKLHDDPRIPIFYTKGPDASDYVSILPGDNADDAIVAKVNKHFHYASLPEYLFTYQEQLFYEAEVYARGLGVPQDLAMANTLYKQALEASALFFGVDPTDAADFAANRADLTSVPDPLYDIYYEQWIDKIDRGVDAFTQWRRSGPDGSEVPNLALPVNAPSGALFRRYEYPAASETSANPNAPDLIRYNVKTWFDL